MCFRVVVIVRIYETWQPSPQLSARMLKKKKMHIYVKTLFFFASSCQNAHKYSGWGGGNKTKKNKQTGHLLFVSGCFMFNPNNAFVLGYIHHMVVCGKKKKKNWHSVWTCDQADGYEHFVEISLHLKLTFNLRVLQNQSAEESL